MNLDPENVPLALRSLLSRAAYWGVGDDYERDCLVEKATDEERQELIHCIDEFQDALFEWLEGPEAKSLTPSKEYVAMTNLTLAIEYAKSLKV